MDWIFDHLQIIVLVAAGIASILTQRKKKVDEQEVSEHMPPPLATPEDVLDHRVREEIARKRAEREGRVAAEQANMPRPSALPTDSHRGPAPGLDEWMEPEPVDPVPVPAGPSAGQLRREAAQREELEAVLARQRELEEKLAELKRSRATAHAEAKAVVNSAYDQVDAAHPAPANAMTLRGLSNPAELRRAFIAAEILGRPKAA